MATPTARATSRSTHHSPARSGRSARCRRAMSWGVDSRPLITLSPKATMPSATPEDVGASTGPLERGRT